MRSGCASTISCSTRQSAPGTALGMQRQRSRLSSFISLQMWSLSAVAPPLMAAWKALMGGPAGAHRHAQPQESFHPAPAARDSHQLWTLLHSSSASVSSLVCWTGAKLVRGCLYGKVFKWWTHAGAMFCSHPGSAVSSAMLARQVSRHMHAL